MSEHTPGPWHVSGRLHIGSMHSPMVLASMNPVHLDTPANARLIAAAPDLLEALENLVDTVNRSDLQEYHMARAAIAKARGEACGEAS